MHSLQEFGEPALTLLGIVADRVDLHPIASGYHHRLTNLLVIPQILCEQAHFLIVESEAFAKLDGSGAMILTQKEDRQGAPYVK